MLPKRRDFLKQGSIVLVLLAAPLHAARSTAQGAALPRLAEDDPEARKHGYRHSSAKVDAQKYPTHKRGQDCDDCLHYTGKRGEAWGGCTVFPGKTVNAKGWCTAFEPKKKPKA